MVSGNWNFSGFLFAFWGKSYSHVSNENKVVHPDLNPKDSIYDSLITTLAKMFSSLNLDHPYSVHPGQSWPN